METYLADRVGFWSLLKASFQLSYDHGPGFVIISNGRENPEKPFQTYTQKKNEDYRQVTQQ